MPRKPKPPNDPKVIIWPHVVSQCTTAKKLIDELAGDLKRFKAFYRDHTAELAAMEEMYPHIQRGTGIQDVLWQTVKTICFFVVQRMGEKDELWRLTKPVDREVTSAAILGVVKAHETPLSKRLRTTFDGYPQFGIIADDLPRLTFLTLREKDGGDQTIWEVFEEHDKFRTEFFARGVNVVTEEMIEANRIRRDTWRGNNVIRLAPSRIFSARQLTKIAKEAGLRDPQSYGQRLKTRRNRAGGELVYDWETVANACPELKPYLPKQKA